MLICADPVWFLIFVFCLYCSEDRYKLFLRPVSNTIAPDYSKIIKTPMDFTTIHKKLQALRYNSVEEFKVCAYTYMCICCQFVRWSLIRYIFEQYDLNLVWRNAQAYNSSSSIPYKQAQMLLRLSTDLFAELERGASEVKEEPLFNPILQLKSVYQHFELYSCDSVIRFVEVCAMCGSAGCHEAFVFCIDCGQSFHDFCVSVRSVHLECKNKQNITKINFRKRFVNMRNFKWRCPNCFVCSTCMKPLSRHSAVICQICDRGYHVKCSKPRVHRYVRIIQLVILVESI